MNQPDVVARRRQRRLKRWGRGLFPSVPIIAIVLLSGALNIVSGMQNPSAPVQSPATTDLTQLNGSLSVLGHGAQALLGGALILLAIGLGFRLRAAWAFTLLLTLVTVAVNVLERQFGASLVLPGVLLLALAFSREVFERRTIFASYLISALSIVAVLAYGIVGSVLLGAGFRPPIRDVFTAMYYTVVTLSTVGYGDIVPVTQQTRLFAITLRVVGIGIFATAIASALGPALAGQLGRLFRKKPAQMVLKNHVIVVGMGAMAENTARELQGRSLDYVRIFEDPKSADAENDRAVVGDPAEEATLRSAGIGRARMLVAAADDDSENAFVSLLAKDLNAGIRVLAVASSQRSIRRLKLARADIVFAPSVVGSRLVANLIEGAEFPAEFADLLERGDEHGS
jgi:voltage-gated potassium channel